MIKKIRAALISVFYKDGLDSLVKQLHDFGITLYSTGGTLQYIDKLGIACIPVESLTTYPSILGGRVKTLHPKVFGGILGRRDQASDLQEMTAYDIPEIDLVIVDLYPFEATLEQVSGPGFSGSKAEGEKLVIEKIDIGGPSMIRAAAKNFQDVAVLASKNEYAPFAQILRDQQGGTTVEQRKNYAAKAFEVVAHYDVAISNYFLAGDEWKMPDAAGRKPLRYGENPHQEAFFYGTWDQVFTQLHGKEISYNNLVDIDAAVQLIDEFQVPGSGASKSTAAVFAIIKHTNVCGISSRPNVADAWQAALDGDPESAFGGVLVTDGTVDRATAEAINEIFFEVLLAPAFDADAMAILQSKKNRILLELRSSRVKKNMMFKGLLNGTLVQDTDEGSFEKWEEAGGRATTDTEKTDCQFANLVCKHLKSNAIAIVRHKQLIGKGCGQTSRVDALRQALDKARQFGFDLKASVLASDAFFPFDDCVQMAHAAGIQAFIQPGGSIRDKDSIAFCQKHRLAMVITGMRHFKH